MSDLLTIHEMIIALHRMRPSMTMRMIARSLGVSKSQVGRVLKSYNAGKCPRCGCGCRGKFV